MNNVKYLNMIKTNLNLIFKISIIALIPLFIYSGLETTTGITGAITWKKVNFVLNELTIAVGILLIILFIVKKQFLRSYDNKNPK